jgi:hypothetical protein
MSARLYSKAQIAALGRVVAQATIHYLPGGTSDPLNRFGVRVGDLTNFTATSLLLAIYDEAGVETPGITP